MGRELIVVWAGRRRAAWEELCRRYRDRVSRQLPIQERVIRPRSKLDPAARLRAEGQAMLDALSDPCWVVAVERAGKRRSSEQLAAWLDRLLAGWAHPVAFLIGSDLGLAEEVRGRARERLSLGPLTLPHELARLVLLEQIYRALSMARGIKYHRQPL